MKGISNSNPNTIVDHAGNPLDDEPSLQFTNGLKATDESANEKVVIGVNTDFEEASTRTNINSGDPFSTILGKIKKWFSDLKTVAFSGSYNDLSNKPAINNGTLTIQKNGTNVATFTANQSGNSTANITVPTKVSELANDSGYTTNIGTVTQVRVGSSIYDPTNGVVMLPSYPTVNNATLTIQKNGSTVNTFTANASSNATANIEVPTKVSELNNDSGYITSSALNTKTLSVSKGESAIAYPITSSQDIWLTIPADTNELTNGAGYITSSGSCAHATSCNTANNAVQAEKASKDADGNYIISTYMKTTGGKMRDGAIITIPSTQYGYSSCDRLKIADSVIFYGYNHTADNASGSYIVNSSQNSPDIDINANHIYFYQVDQSGQTKTICVFDAAGNTTNINSYRNYMNLRADDGITCFKTTSDTLVNINAANVESSVRFKENIKDITEDEAKKLLDVRAITFDFKEKYAPNERERYGQAGVIAEEVLDIYPNLVRYSNIDTEDGKEVPTFVEYSHFAPYLIKLAQMQQKEIDELKSIVANQQKEIDELKKK